MSPAPDTLAAERTGLSWSRTAIALLAYAALVGQTGISGGRVALVVSAGAIGMAAAAVGMLRRPALATAAVGLAGLVAVVAALLPPLP